MADTEATQGETAGRRSASKFEGDDLWHAQDVQHPSVPQDTSISGGTDHTVLCDQMHMTTAAGYPVRTRKQPQYYKPPIRSKRPPAGRYKHEETRQTLMQVIAETKRQLDETNQLKQKQEQEHEKTRERLMQELDGTKRELGETNQVNAELQTDLEETREQLRLERIGAAEKLKEEINAAHSVNMKHQEETNTLLQEKITMGEQVNIALTEEITQMKLQVKLTAKETARRTSVDADELKIVNNVNAVMSKEIEDWKSKVRRAAEVKMEVNKAKEELKHQNETQLRELARVKLENAEKIEGIKVQLGEAYKSGAQRAQEQLQAAEHSAAFELQRAQVLRLDGEYLLRLNDELTEQCDAKDQKIEKLTQQNELFRELTAASGKPEDHADMDHADMDTLESQVQAAGGGEAIAGGDEAPGAPAQQTLEQQTLTSILKRCETPKKGLQSNIVERVRERGMGGNTPLEAVPIDPYTSSIWLCSQAGASEDTTAEWAYLCVGFKMYFVAMTLKNQGQTCYATETWPMPVMAMYRVGIVQHTSYFKTLVHCAAACNTLLLLARKKLSYSNKKHETDPICGQTLLPTPKKSSIEKLCGFVASLHAEMAKTQDGREALQSLITAAVESVGVVTTKEVVSRARTDFRQKHPIPDLDGGPLQKHAAVPVRVGVMTPDPLGGNTNLYSMLCDSQQSSVSRSTTASLLGLAAHLVFELSLTKPKHHRNTITTMPLPSIVVGMAAADALRRRYKPIDNGRVGTLSLWPKEEGGHVGNRFVGYRPDFVFRTDKDILVSVELKTVWRRSGQVPRTVDYQHRLQTVLQAIACGADEAVLLRITVPYGEDLTTLRVECIRLDMSSITGIDGGVHTKLEYNMKKLKGFVDNSGMNTTDSVDELLKLALAQTKSQLSDADNRSWVIYNRRAEHGVQAMLNPVTMRDLHEYRRKVAYIKGVVILASQPLSWL